MNGSQARRILLVMWLGAVGLQLANQIITTTNPQTQGGQTSVQTPSSTMAYLVPPHKLLASSIVFTGLFALAEMTPTLALALGAAVDLLALLGPLVTNGTSGGATLFDRITSLVQAEA